MQIVQIPWDRSPRFRMPVEVWRRTIDAHYPYRGWVPVHTDTLDAARARARPSAALPTFDAVVDELLGRARRRSERAARAPRLLAALRGLRALPLHAGRDQERDPDPVRDRLPARLRGAQPGAPSTTCGSSACSRPDAERELTATVRFLQAAGERHRRSSGGSSWPARSPSSARRRAGDRVRVRRRAAAPRPGAAARRAARARGACAGQALRPQPTSSSDRGGSSTRGERPGREPALDPRRARGDRRALRLAARARRRVGAAVAGCESVNTCPVLATPGDDARPRRRDRAPRPPAASRPRASATCSTTPRSRRRCCCTCRRSATTERERDRRPGPGGAGDDRARRAPRPRSEIASPARTDDALQRPCSRPGAGRRAAPNPGEAELEIDGSPFRKGAKVVLRPGDRPRRLRPDARRPHGDDRAHLHRLRGRRPRRGHGRRRPRPGPVSRDRALPVLQRATSSRWRANEPASAASARSSSPGSATPGWTTTASAATSPRRSRSASCRRASPCSTSAPAGSTSPTR